MKIRNLEIKTELLIAYMLFISMLFLSGVFFGRFEYLNGVITLIISFIGLKFMLKDTHMIVLN